MMRSVRLTTPALHRIITEETRRVLREARYDDLSEALMTPEEEVSLSKQRPAGRSKGSAAAPEGSFEDFERGYKQRELDRRWAALTKRWPRLTAEVGREAFDREWTSREEGAAGGGGHLTYADEFRILLDLLEKS